MDCPVCKTNKLVMTQREGIEIDYCPECRGVWLDRGELDKIIDRAAAAQESRAAAPPPPAHLRQVHPVDPFLQAQQYGAQRAHGHYPKKKRDGFLSELFDFD